MLLDYFVWNIIWLNRNYLVSKSPRAPWVHRLCQAWIQLHADKYILLIAVNMTSTTTRCSDKKRPISHRIEMHTNHNHKLDLCTVHFRTQSQNVGYPLSPIQNASTAQSHTAEYFRYYERRDRFKHPLSKVLLNKYGEHPLLSFAYLYFN